MAAGAECASCDSVLERAGRIAGAPLQRRQFDAGPGRRRRDLHRLAQQLLGLLRWARRRPARTGNAPGGR